MAAPQWHGLTGRRDREFRLAGGCSSRSARRGWRPPMARAHRLWGGGVQPSCWLQLTVRLVRMAAQAWGRGVKTSGWWQLTVRLWGMSAPNGAGSHARGMGSPAQLVVPTLRAPEGDGSPQWRRLTGRGDMESRPAGGPSSGCTCGGWRPMMVRGITGWGDGESSPASEPRRPVGLDSPPAEIVSPCHQRVPSPTGAP